jgi:ABC-type proline/glycine betaine transport system permease subunit
MVGELLYHLHRHFRLVLITGALALVVGVSVLGWEAVRHKGEPARPAEAGQA